MNHALRSLPVIVIAGMLLAAGCGDNDEQRPRFNENLGDSPGGAPIGTGPIDAGILQDQTSYKPTAFEPLEGVAAAPGSAGGGGAEAEDAKAAVDGIIDSIFEMDVDVLLDGFVPEQVAALREDPCMQALYDTTDALGALSVTIESKGTGPEFDEQTDDPSAELWAAELKKIVTITLLDEHSAVVKFAPERLPQEHLEQLGKVIGRMTAFQSAFGGAAAAESPPQAATPAPNAAAAGAPAAGAAMPPDLLLSMLSNQELAAPLRKVDDEWRLALSFSFNEEHADLIAEGLEILREMFDTINRRANEAETLDMQTLEQISAQAGMTAGPQLLGWAARANPVFEELMDAPGAAAGEGEVAPVDDSGDESAEPEEPNTP